MISSAQGQSHRLPVFSAVMKAAKAEQIVPISIGQKFWHIESTSAA